MNIELMQRVRAKVLAEPSRVNMARWQSKKRFLGLFPCGTVCCIAGHAIEEQGGCVPAGDLADVTCAAAELLQIPDSEGVLLFFFHAGTGGMRFTSLYGMIASIHTLPDPYLNLRRKLSIYRPGTPQYAAVVAEAIDRCIARNHKSGPQPEPEPEPEPVFTKTDTKYASELGVKV